MRNKRVVIYGGTDLIRDSAVPKFVRSLAYELLKTDQVRLATGGFKSYRNQESDGESKKVQSTDVAVLEGAQQFASDQNLPLESVFETWLPEETKDRRDEGGPDRFREGKVQVLHGLSDQARRLRLVQIADALITIKGKVRTALVLEMAMAIGRPALPLPFTEVTLAITGGAIVPITGPV